MPKRSDNRAEPEALRIETMGAGDLRRVLEIERSVFPTPWPLESFRYELRNPRARNLVARRGSEILGYVCVWLIDGELKINNIAVRRDFRRRGLGTRLLSSVLEMARARDCTEATLEVRPSNREALELYRRSGFRSVGTRKAYYQDTGEDAILMRKELG